jgi:hypothetical protein
MFSVISRDAGGAELACRFVLKQKEDFCLALSGPAIKIFKNKIKNIKIISKIDAIKRSDWVLCSTGTTSNFEKNGIILAKKNKKKVVVLLDHWTEYRNRFIKENKLFLPNEIWVMDKYALKIIKKEKFKTKIILKKNLFFEEFKKKLKISKKIKKNSSLKKNIIFLSEWVNPAHKKKYRSNECLKFLLENLSSLSFKINKITIRFHPEEKIQDLNWTSMYHDKVKISNNKYIFDDILNHDVIIGINTVALVFGLIAKKKVISCIPYKKGVCDLPHKGIIDFRKII